MDGQRVHYVRGAGGVVLPTRRVLAVALAFIATVLVAITVTVTVVDLQRTARHRSLARNGITVTATVTGCVANASGTGITESGFTCRGRYRVNGQIYDRVFQGSSRQYPFGSRVQGITSTDRPSELYSPNAVRTGLSYSGALVLPLVLTAMLIATLTCEVVVILGMRKPRRFSTGKSLVCATQTSASSW